MLVAHFKKFLVIFMGGVVFLILIISDLHAQEKPAVDEIDKIKSMLLNEEGWIAEWHCNYWPFDTFTDLSFEDRGKKIVVKIFNSDNSLTYTSCKRKVIITSDGFQMSGCNEGNVQLIFDPKDQRYPFKGKNHACELKIKQK